MNKISSDLMSLSDDILSDDSESANADIGNAVQSCPKVALNIGVFFDGTYNNAANVQAFQSHQTDHTGGSYDNFYSNVWKLRQIYSGPDQNTRASCGSVDEAFEPIYVAGIGTETGGDDSRYGGATGTGISGIEARLRQVFDSYIPTILTKYKGLPSIRSLTFDVFGFSRGAATARVFANLIAEGRVAGAQVRFLGIFDTVASFGIPGNNRQSSVGEELAQAYCEIPLNVNPLCMLVPSDDAIDLNVRANTADTVFHITAGDEYRQFFPLSSALPSQAIEVEMPGCHGDVGGAVPTTAVEETYKGPLAPTLVNRGWFDQAEEHVREFPQYGRMPERRMVTHIRKVQPGIGNASLHAMYNRAKSVGVPFLDINELPGVDVPADLRGLTSALTAGLSVTGAAARPICAKYVHNSGGSFFSSNMVEWDFERDIYPNKP
ncbi:T6SS phospholipase effector Tle1-like catalytic domain-containing protein [Thalassospira marina]|uniref:T6SS Phospholipase effector Tle1-like catalytic domain-containing protein n=1 Tax=Thalassospira marina TaxID=2048283 RepID=A0A2N3KGM4_9PROT|nr:DUF2235 domain-containing protein [Thalassospira marina]PKR49722.1 hypothetical protein COO20_22105 [Thalassospira marina]